MLSSKVEELLNEMHQLLEHLRQEIKETQGYHRQGDKSNTLRNLNDSRDELNTLLRKWEDLTKELHHL